ncbi:MAG: hypothetical protein EOP46_09760 [Sphingobacteriaceae bacterium]|nr:MAG: hypothetical protein EOP46_09760 [Sphingobacteriaceae bacterium]
MLLQILPPDGSMPYTETNMANFFPEPWNMVTSALFLIPSFYWIIKLKGFDKNHAFLSVAVWLLLTGCIGSTVYHGFRQWSFFMYMDWVPIALLCMLASIYFIFRVTGNKFYGFGILVAFAGLELLLQELYYTYDKHVMFTLNYLLMVLMIVGPLLALLIKTRWKNGWLVAGAFTFFGLALFFRLIDTEANLPMGTHFLWHTFGAVATSMIFLFIYKMNSVVLVKQPNHEDAVVLPLYTNEPEVKTGS